MYHLKWPTSLVGVSCLNLIVYDKSGPPRSLKIIATGQNLVIKWIGNKHIELVCMYVCTFVAQEAIISKTIGCGYQLQ